MAAIYAARLREVDVLRDRVEAAAQLVEAISPAPVPLVKNERQQRTRSCDSDSKDDSQKRKR